VATVSSEAVKEYWPLFESRARRFVGAKGAEYDDLVQEAAISGWLSMEAGYPPNTTVLDRACMRYVRSLYKGGWRLVSESFQVHSR
jgi:hypothetical protein